MSSAPSQQAGQETAERDRGAVSLWSRLPLRHGRQWLHPANPYPCQQSWTSHRQKRRDHQTTAGLRCNRIYCQHHHTFITVLNVSVNNVNVLQNNSPRLEPSSNFICKCLNVPHIFDQHRLPGRFGNKMFGFVVSGVNNLSCLFLVSSDWTCPGENRGADDNDSGRPPPHRSR